MKKILFFAFCALGLFTSINTTKAQCSLDQIGGVNTVTASALSDMTAANGGTVYTVSYHNTLGKIFLHSAVIAGSYTVVANIPTITSVKPIVRINKANGKVYVVIKDDGAGQVGKVYYLSAGSLIQLGPAFSGTNKVSDLSIAFNSLGEEYVAYTDLTNSNKSTVKKWDGVSAWINVGTGIVSSGAGFYNSLAIDKTDAPVLAYQSIANSSVTAVSKFTGSWGPVGIGTVGSAAANSKLKVASNGDYYLGYTELSGNVVVQKYSGTWGTLGSPVSAMSFTANTFDLDLDPTDMPYFICQNNTSYYPVAFKYTGVPTWVNVIGGNLSITGSTNLNVSIDNTGSPYFFYVDASNGNGLNIKTITSPISISSQPLSVTRCNGQSGSFSVGTVGGVPASYQWQTLGAGTYTNSSAPYTNVTTSSLAFTANTSMNQNQVRCVVNVGCKNIISNTATLSVSTLSATSSFTNPTCFNTGDGAISVTVSGGVTPYSYTWSPVGGNTPNPTGLYWNTYTLNTTDINGCSLTNTVTLTSPPSISTSFSGNMNICSGSNTTLTITATGGTPGYTYSWTPGGSISPTTSSVVIATPGSSQTYNVSVTDAMGCVATDTVMVNVSASPTVTAISSTICNGSNATLNASGAHTYTWNPGGLIGAIQNVTPSSTTNYTVVGTNTLSGCTNSATALVTVNPLPTANAGTTRTLTCANTSTTLAGSGGGTYSWTGPGIVSGATTANPTINAIGNYSLLVTSAAGCTSTVSTVSVVQNTTAPSPTAANSGTLTCATTTIGLTGTGGGTYNWSGPGIVSGGATANPVVNQAGCYNLTVTAVNGCTASAVTCVTQNTLAPATTTAVSGVLNCTLTSVNASATTTTSPVTFNWSGAGITSATNISTITVNAGGIKNYTVTNSINGCSTTNSLNVSQNLLAPTATAASSGTVTCLTTTINLTGTPSTGVTYTWTAPSGSSISSGANSQNAIGSGPGTYSFFIQSTTSGCTNGSTVTVNQNTVAPLVTGGVSGTLTCITSTVNAISATTVTPASYIWTGTGIVSGASTGTIAVNQPGIFSYTVTNTTNGCKSTGTRIVTQNTVAPSGVNAGMDQLINCSVPTVTLTGSVSSPTNALYNWSGGVCGSTTTSITTACSANMYTLTATDPINGCNALDVMQVNMDIAVPSVSLSANSSTITCFNPTVSVVATTTVGSVSYSWSPAVGIVGGSGSTSTPYFNATGSYSLIVTNLINGCVTNPSSNVVDVYTDNTIPTISIAATPSIICSGGTTTLTASSSSDPNSNYVWNPGSLNGAIQALSPLSTTLYSVVVTNTINGCAGTETVNVTVNTTPTLAITGNTNICNGSTSTLTGSGATSYTWNTGANTNTISVTPTITTTYTLDGDNGNGCFSSLPVTVSIIPNKTISGVITSTAGATGGNVIIYPYTAALSHWDTLAITPIGGTYTFNNIDSGLYVIRAIPTATNIQVTYAPNSISWQGATIINHGCSNNTSQNINLIGLDLFTPGPGVVTGSIVEAAGFVPRMSNEFKPAVPGTPIGGIIVKGGKNPGGQMLVQTLTDPITGTYTLTGFPINTLPDDYFIFVDIPGLDTNSTYYHISFAINDTVVNGLDFNVDAQYINPIGSVTAISNDESVLESKITLFPNPAKQNAFIEYTLTNSANVQIELFDILGNKVKTINENVLEEKGKRSHPINIENLSSGIYFVKLNINNSMTTMKLIINP